MARILARDVKPTMLFAFLGKPQSLLIRLLTHKLTISSERKKSHDKVYPKGYVEMLEQQQGQLVSGLQEMYRQLLAGQRWSGPALSETSGHPLTHDILAALNLLEAKHDGSGEMEAFEDDCLQLQSRLFQAGAPCMRRKGSFSSESDRSQRGNSVSTAISTPNVAKPSVFKENFSFSTSPSPIVQSPAPRKRQSHPPVYQSPLHQSRQLSNDPELYQTEWSTLAQSGSPEAIMRFAMEAPHLQSNLDDVADMLNAEEWIKPNGRFDSAVNGLTSYPAQFSNPFDSLSNFQDFGTNMDTMDIDFNRWIQVQM